MIIAPVQIFYSKQCLPCDSDFTILYLLNSEFSNMTGEMFKIRNKVSQEEEEEEEEEEETGVS